MNMRNKILLIIGASCCAASIGAATLQNVGITSLALTRNANSDYVLVLNSDNTPSGLTSSYQNSFTGNVKTNDKNTVTMNFVNAKSYSGGFVELANHGKIFNFASSDTKLTSVNGIKFTGTGSLLFKPGVGLYGDGAILADLAPISISAGASKASVPVCDYFEIEAGDSGAQITSLELYYTCDPNAYDSQLLNGTYTGKGNDNYTYQLTINNGTATLASLDKQSNTSLTGTASLSSKTNASISLNGGSVVYSLTYDGHALSYTSMTGSGPQISFDRVYTIDNFESYTASGQGYTNSTTKYQTTGLRSHYYADYYTSGTGEIGGSNWPVMTSTDNTTYTSNKGHNGSKGAAFKFSNGMQMRYISMNELYGVKSVIGKGMTLSIWARGAYTNSSLTTDHSANIPVSAYLYYDSPLTPSTHTSVHDLHEFTVMAGNTWQHFEFEISPGETFYGFGLNTKQTSGTTAYIVFDDIQIYTASPYAEYHYVPANYPEGTFRGSVRHRSGWTNYDYDITISIGNYLDGMVAVIIDNVHNLNASNISFVESTNKITITTNGTFDGSTITNLTGTYNASTNKITSIQCSGYSLTANNSSATLVTASSSFYDCEGTTSQLQSKFKRRYKTGNDWIVDTTNQYRIFANNNHYVSGNSALTLKGQKNGSTALNLNSDLGSTISVSYINFWVYNPTNSNVTVKVWVYTSTGLSNNVALDAVNMVATAHSWTYCHSYHANDSGKLVTSNMYNFQIADLSGSGANLVFDNIYLYA